MTEAHKNPEPSEKSLIDKLKENAQNLAHAAKESTQQLAEAAKDTVADAKEVLSEKATQAKDFLKEDFEKTKADAQQLADAAKEKASGAKDTLSEKADAGSAELKNRVESAYDKFSEKFSELYQAGQEKSREAMDKALDVAKEQLAAAGEVSAEQAEKFKDYLKRDLEQTQADMKVLGDETQKRLHPSRLGAGAVSVLSNLLQSASKGFEFLSEKAEKAITYKTGEVTSAGTLTCIKCEQTLKIEKTTHIPPCPKCHSTEFRKSY